MRILHTVEFYTPSVGGAQEVVKQISERLVKRGHEVAVATTKLVERTESVVNGVRIEEFDVSGNAVRGFRGEVERYQEFLLNGTFDVMMNYAAQQWATDAVFPVLEQLPYPKVLVPCGFSALYNPAYVIYFAAMPQIMRRYDHLVFLSNSYRDVEFARQHGIHHFSIIPNGAGEDEFAQIDQNFRKRYGIPEDAFMLLTVGSHTGAKGHRFCIEAFKRARIRLGVLVIIGNTFGEGGCLTHCRRQSFRTWVRSFGRKKVLLLEPPRRDVVAAFHAADVFVFGSNIECSPLVLFEAMASGTPFLTVACGNAEEIIEWSGGGLLVDTEQLESGYVEGSVQHMAALIEELYHDPELRQQLGDAGRSAWKKRFTWERIAEDYEALYYRLVADSTQQVS